MNDADPIPMATHDLYKLEARKSRVRVVVTYLFAVGFTFYTGAGAWLLFTGDVDNGVDKALQLLREYGVVAGILIAYWFGGRGAGKSQA